MDFLKETYNLLAPTAIVGAAVTYWFGMRQKRFDLNQEHYKKIRLTVSDLLLIWNEYAKLERFLKSNDPTNSAIYQVPELAEKFFSVDQRKLKKMNKSFLLSIENLKEIDIALFHKLEGSLDSFNKTNKEVFTPILQSRIIENDVSKEIIIPVLDELLETIEEIILDTVKHLPRKERRSVRKVLDKHLKGVKELEEDSDLISEVPEFLVKLINNSLKPKTPFTQDDFRDFYSDKTVNWIMAKFLSVANLRKTVFSKAGGIKLLFAMLSGDQDSLKQTFSSVNEDEFHISKEEANIFIRNKAFYKLIMGFIQKVDGHVPMKLKRELVKANTGQTSLHTESSSSPVTQNEEEELVD
ncbi:MAG: hypothetical protein QE487_16000 [Fluviicola sp.]|nr:hypothetical protein [Fluviicola sp.]